MTHSSTKFYGKPFSSFWHNPDDKPMTHQFAEASVVSYVQSLKCRSPRICWYSIQWHPHTKVQTVKLCYSPVPTSAYPYLTAALMRPVVSVLWNYCSTLEPTRTHTPLSPAHTDTHAHSLRCLSSSCLLPPLLSYPSIQFLWKQHVKNTLRSF